MYIGHEKKFTLRWSSSHHAKVGHLVKSRADENHILYNRLMDEADGTSSYAINLPNGGTSYVIGNLVQQGPQTQNAAILAYGEEGTTNPKADLYVVNNTFVNGLHCRRPLRLRHRASPRVAAHRQQHLSPGQGEIMSRISEASEIPSGSSNLEKQRPRRRPSVFVDAGRRRLPPARAGAPPLPAVQSIPGAANGVRPRCRLAG